MLGELLGDSVAKETRPSSLSRQRKVSGGGGGGERLIFLKLLAAASFLVLLATLIKAQILAGGYYRDLANGNRVRQVAIHAPRGIIFDRFGIPLTANLPAFRLLTCQDKEKNECLSETVSKDQAIALEAAGNLSQNQSLEVDSIRSYLKASAFAHLLGYVAEVSEEELKNDGSYHLGDKIGRGGLEEFYENVLRGKDGRELVEVDAMGRKIRTISTVAPVPGENLTLTVDARIQQTAFDALGGKNGAVVVANPSSGEILAMVSSPTFNPNLFTDFSLPAAERAGAIAKLFNDPGEPMFDRALGGTFPPGSTFKLVTATAALETEAIKTDTLIEDTGVLVVGPYKFPNWKWLSGGGVEGWLDVSGAIQKSNDIFFYRAGELTGIDNLMAWAKKFGLGKKLGIDLPGEATGLVPDLAWREANTRNWYLGDTYHVAIGQGDLLVTPLQNNFWTNAIANNGKLCTPRVVDSKRSEVNSPQCRDLGIKKETISAIKKGMVAACAPGGTAYPLFGFNVPLACKTGTAEFGTQSKTHGWLTLFAPAEKPEISITVLVEGGGEGSDVAAPIAKKILEKWFTK